MLLRVRLWFTGRRPVVLQVVAGELVRMRRAFFVPHRQADGSPKIAASELHLHTERVYYCY